jgi:metal-responsive CopG/Arc/MetJ family transcriptional regulator
VYNCILTDIRVIKIMASNIESMVKKRVAVTISNDLLKWVDEKVKETTFANRSHAIEHALTKLKEAEK